jgi:hypothetical protein
VVVNDSYAIVYGSYAVVYGSYAVVNDSYAVVYGSYAIVYGSYAVVNDSYAVVYGSYLENTLSPLSYFLPTKPIRSSRTEGSLPDLPILRDFVPSWDTGRFWA